MINVSVALFSYGCTWEVCQLVTLGYALSDSYASFILCSPCQNSTQSRSSYRCKHSCQCPVNVMAICFLFSFQFQLLHSKINSRCQKNNTLALFSLSGNPPQLKAWAGQCILYLCAVIVEKATITLLVQLNFWIKVRKFILLPVKNHPKVELAIVMLIIPFVFNVSIHCTCTCYNKC